MSERARAVLMLVCYVGVIATCIWDAYAQLERHFVIRDLVLIAVAGPFVGTEWSRLPRLLRVATAGILLIACVAGSVAVLAALVWGVVIF